MAEKIISLFAGLFVGVYVARYLGPERFGLLSYAMSFVALFGAFAKLGLDGVLVRNLVQAPANRDELLGTAFVLQALGGIILLVLVFTVIRVMESEVLTIVIVMITAGGFTLQIFKIIELYFQSQVLSRSIAIASITALLFSSVIKISLVSSEAALIWFAWVFFFDQLFNGVLLSILYTKQNLSLWRWRFSFEQAKMLLKDSWPMIISSFAIILYMRVDQVMIKVILDNKAVGNYAAAVKIAEAWYFVFILIAQSTFPAILNAKKVSLSLYRTRLQRLFSLVTTITCLVSAIVWLCSDEIIVFLYHDKFQEAAPVLGIYVWAGILVGLNNVSWRWHLAENNQVLAFYRLSLGAVLNIVLNYFLLPYYGINGAAVATLISYFFAVVIGNLFFRETKVLFWMQIRSFCFFSKRIL